VRIKYSLRLRILEIADADNAIPANSNVGHTSFGAAAIVNGAAFYDDVEYLRGIRWARLDSARKQQTDHRRASN
jgi:hypothetical protein